MKFLGIKKFQGRTLDQILTYLKVDVSKAFNDLTTILAKPEDPQIVRATAFATTTIATSLTDVSGGILALPRGIWQVFYAVTGEVETGATSANNTLLQVYMYQSDNVLVDHTESRLYAKTVAGVSNFIQAMMTGSTVVTVRTNQSYKLRGIVTNGAGTGAVRVLEAPTAGFYAVRLDRE